MSAKLMGMVWDVVLPHGEQSIMLALADHGEVDAFMTEGGEAVHVGVQIFPSVERLMHKTGYDRRNVQRLLRQLEKKGLIVPVAFVTGGRKHATEYEMHLYRGEQKPPFKQERAANETEVKGGISDTSTQRAANETQRAANETLKGGISTQRAANETLKGGLYTAPTIIEPSREPSENRQDPTRARAREPSPPVNEFSYDGFWRWLRQQPGGTERFDPKRRDRYLTRYDSERLAAQ